MVNPAAEALVGVLNPSREPEFLDVDLRLFQSSDVL